SRRAGESVQITLKVQNPADDEETLRLFKWLQDSSDTLKTVEIFLKGEERRQGAQGVDIDLILAIVNTTVNLASLVVATAAFLSGRKGDSSVILRNGKVSCRITQEDEENAQNIAREIAERWERDEPGNSAEN